MDSVSSTTSSEDTQRLVFTFLEFLQQAKQSPALSEETVESVEVACQCLASAFQVNLENTEQHRKYSLGAQSLSSVLALGLSGKQRIEQAVEQLHKKQDESGSATDIEQKFLSYLQALQRRGAFNGAQPGSPEYEQIYTKARQRFVEKYKGQASQGSPTVAATPTPMSTEETAVPVVENIKEPTQEEVAAAEQHKMSGNQFLASKQYSEAVASYSQAISANPNNAIYYANRAAAYSHMGMHDKAIDDCKISIQKDPNYSKAYGRLGLAYFSLGKYAEAAEQYRRGLQLEPNSISLQQSLSSAEKKLAEGTSTGSGPAPTPTSAAAAPNFGDLLNNPDLQNTIGNMFGGQSGFNFGEIMNNPMFQNMAQQMMQNPQMMNLAGSMMQNPDALSSMMEAMGAPQEEPAEREQEEQ